MPDGMAVRLFETRSFACILSGIGYQFRRSPPVLDLIDDAPAKKLMANVRSEIERVAAAMPSHYQYLRTLHQNAGAASGER
jgi:hypothetical protein